MVQEQKQQEFESQKLKEELTQAESEEIAVRKRRAEGTPCTKENFYAWKEKFDLEMEEKAEKEAQEALKDQTNSKKSKNSNAKSKEEEMEGRLTGYQQFSEKLGLVNLDALEKAAEEAVNLDVEDLDVDEDLFDDESDLDDLDFDDEEESDDDDDDDDDEDDLSI